MIRVKCLFLKLGLLGLAMFGAFQAGYADGGDGVLLSDGFVRFSSPPLLTPWSAQQGSWGITNKELQGTGGSGTYSFGALATNWTDYSVEARVQFSSRNGLGGGIGGRVNATNGAHYGAWIYP